MTDLSKEVVNSILSEAADALRLATSQKFKDAEIDGPDLADKLDRVKEQVLSGSEEQLPAEYISYLPLLESLNNDIAVFKLHAEGEVAPEDEPKFHIILDRKHWEAMQRPGQIKVPILSPDA
jgi:hypothetical protein